MPPDGVDRVYIIHGVKCGFNLCDGDLSQVPVVETSNYFSCSHYLDLVEQHIRHELMQGNYKITETTPRIGNKNQTNTRC